MTFLIQMGLIKIIERLHLGVRVTEVKKKGAFEKKDPLKRKTSLWRAGYGPAEDPAFALKTATTEIVTRLDLSRLYLFALSIVHIIVASSVWYFDLHGRYLPLLVNLAYVGWIVGSFAAYEAVRRYFRFRVLDVVYPEMIGAVDGHLGRREVTLAELRRARRAKALLRLHRASEGGYWRAHSPADEHAMHNRLARLLGRMCDPNDAVHDPTFLNLRIKDRADVLALAVQAAFVPTEAEMCAVLERRMDLSKARAGFMTDEFRSF